MFEALKGITFSLRFRLIAAACAALVLGLWMLAANSVRLLDEALLARENRHLAELQALYSASLAVPLAERDHARLTRLVAQLGQQTGTRYFVLTDAARRVVAAEGWDPLAPLPPAMQDFALLPREATRFDGMVTLRLGEREVGSAHFGIDTQFLRQASANLLWQSTAIGWAALLLTAVLLAFVSYWLTRNLRVLQQGVAALEGGATDVRLPAGGNDEIGRLTRAFNRMSQALDERVEALKKSEARFHAIADYTYGVEAWFNPRGRLIWINRSVERITGYTPLECLLSNNLVDMQLEVVAPGIVLSGTNQRFGARGMLRILPDSKLTLRNSEFDVREGWVRFDDPVRIAPKVDVRAQTEYRRAGYAADTSSEASATTATGGAAGLAATSGQWRIQLHAHGDAEDLKVNLTSDPPLSQEDIVLLLTVGMTRAEVDRGLASTLGETVGLEALTSLTGADKAIKKAVPIIDEFRFGTGYSSRTGRTEPTVTVGKKVTDSVRANVTTGITENREVRSTVEWRLNRTLSVQGSYDNANDNGSSVVGNVGADLRWRLEFE